MKIWLAFYSGLLATLLCAGVWAQAYTPFPGTVVDNRTRHMQERVEEIYTAGNHERALLIYEKDLAPLGDKYAQYMVGFMHLNAEGVQQDRVEALSWFRLAAERSEPLLVEVRDALVAQLSPAEIRASDVRFLELWKSIGDRKLIMELIQDDLNILRSQTGTRITGSVVSGPSIVFKPNGEQLGPNYYLRVRNRLVARLNYLDAKVNIVDPVLAEEFGKARNLETGIKQELAALDNP